MPHRPGAVPDELGKVSSTDHLCRWPCLREENLGRERASARGAQNVLREEVWRVDRYGDFPWRREPLKGFTQELGTLRPALQKLPGNSVECGLRKRSLRTLGHWEDPALIAS